jgi:hypothetical protein
MVDSANYSLNSSISSRRKKLLVTTLIVVFTLVSLKAGIAIEITGQQSILNFIQNNYALLFTLAMAACFNLLLLLFYKNSLSQMEKSSTTKNNQDNPLLNTPLIASLSMQSESSSEEAISIQNKITNWKNRGEYKLYKAINDANKHFPYSGFLAELSNYIHCEYANLYVANLNEELITIAKYGNSATKEDTMLFLNEEAKKSNSSVLMIPIRMEFETIGILEVGSYGSFCAAERELLDAAAQILTPKVVSHFLQKNYTRRITA